MKVVLPREVVVNLAVALSIACLSRLRCDRNRVSKCLLGLLLMWLAVVSASPAYADRPSGIAKVSADAGHLSIMVAASADSRRQCKLIEIPIYQVQAVAGKNAVVWQGVADGEPIQIDRFDGVRDRLFSRWQLVDATTDAALGGPRYADDLTRLSPRTNPLNWPKSIKGLQSIVDIDDAIQLGVKHAGHNVLISQVIDLTGGPAKLTWDVDGEKIPIRADFIRHLDTTFKKTTDAGINNTIILLNRVPANPDPQNPLIHPLTDLQQAPNRLGAFNLTDQRGTRYFRAALEFLSNRYSQPDSAHGLVSGYVIGNEIQAHWWWYNMGNVPAEAVVDDYVRALRVAHLCVRKYHPEIRVYVSMDHHWTASPPGGPSKTIAGKVLLDSLNTAVKNEGNFEWHVAFHPYPEDLFNPRTWEDKNATPDSTTPKITFRNLQVLSNYLRREEFLFHGRPRRIILSEQGFHTPDGAEGEKLQAAAFAYAYYRAKHTDGIDAFILHRHVDHEHEGGLRLGIWTRKPDTVTTLGRKKFLWNVFREADGDDWESAFEFAKPIIGIERWKAILPAPRQ